MTIPNIYKSLVTVTKSSFIKEIKNIKKYLCIIYMKEYYLSQNYTDLLAIMEVTNSFPKLSED